MQGVLGQAVGDPKGDAGNVFDPSGESKVDSSL